MVSQNIENNIRRVADMMNTGDFTGLQELVAEDATYRTTLGFKTQGHEEFKQLRSLYADGFDNFKLEPLHIFTEGNTAVVIYKQTGTHTGEFMGIEPTNNKWDQLGCNIITLDDDGKLVDIFDLFDQLELLVQLDAVPQEMKELTEGLSTRPGA